MAELTLTTFLTRVGVVRTPGGPGEDPSGNFRHGGWLVPHADGDMGTTMDEIFSKADAFLLGRTTYDIFAGYWLKKTDPQEPVASKLNAEYRLRTFPVVPGSGKRRFGAGAVPATLALVSTRTTSRGVYWSELRHAPSGSKAETQTAGSVLSDAARAGMDQIVRFSEGSAG